MTYNWKKMSAEEFMELMGDPPKFDAATQKIRNDLIEKFLQRASAVLLKDPYHPRPMRALAADYLEAELQIKPDLRWLFSLPARHDHIMRAMHHYPFVDPRFANTPSATPLTKAQLKNSGQISIKEAQARAEANKKISRKLFTGLFFSIPLEGGILVGNANTIQMRDSLALVQKRKLDVGIKVEFQEEVLYDIQSRTKDLKKIYEQVTTADDFFLIVQKYPYQNWIPQFRN